LKKFGVRIWVRIPGTGCYIDKDILIVQIDVDDIIFGSDNNDLCKDFKICMKEEFEVSMMGELNYFLRLQIKQKEDEIFLN